MTARDGTPLVTLVIAMLNEADAIELCLRSVLAQDYPADRLEILVYDGGSTDESAAIARRVLGDRPLAAVQDNLDRVQAAAWNLGIAAASGDIVGVMSAHAEIGPRYVTAAVAALERTRADLVGGPVHAVGDGLLGEAVAAAISTPFGAGGARFRLTDREEAVDTVFMGLASRETYLRFPFDPEMERDQDDEHSYRILDAGGRIVCDPAIESAYRARTTLGGLARQYWEYGYWKVRVLQKHPGQVRMRHLVPPLFVVGMAGALALLPVRGLPRTAGGIALGTYAIATVGGSVAAARGRARLLPFLPLVFPTLHVAYGAGFLAGLTRFRRGWPAGAPRQMVAALIGRWPDC